MRSVWLIACLWCATLPASAAELSVSQQWASAIDQLDFKSLPGPIAARLRLTVADCVGVIAYTRRLEEVERYRGIAAHGSAAEAIELVGGRRVGVREAAAINAFAIHGHEIDDSNLRCQVRASCVALPGPLAVAEQQGASGRELFLALAIAFHIGDRLGTVTNLQPEGRLHARGWMPSSVCGAVGSAAGCAKLLELSPDQTASSIGLAAGGANGTFQYYREGSDEKRIHVARSQALAVESAQLAQGGFRAAPHAIEGEAGLLRALGMTFEVEDLVRDFDRWDGVLHVKPKFYACSQGVIPWLETVTAMRSRRPFRAADVRRITITIPHPADSLYARKINDFRPPQSTIDAQLSVNIGLALLIAGNDAFIDDYNEASLADPTLLALADKVQAMSDAARAGAVEIALSDGSAITGQYDPATLLAPYEADEAAYRYKFDRLTAAYSPAQRDALWRHALALEEAPQVGDWMAELVRLFDATR